MKLVIAIVALIAAHQYLQMRKNAPISGHASRDVAAIADLAPENEVDIYMTPNCGGCPICKRQVANIGKAGIAHKIHELKGQNDFVEFITRIRKESGDDSVAGPANPVRFPAMRVNGKWLQGPELEQVKPHLIYGQKF